MADDYEYRLAKERMMPANCPRAQACAGRGQVHRIGVSCPHLERDIASGGTGKPAEAPRAPEPLAEAREILENFTRWAEPLAGYAGSQLADDEGMSQEFHWLNETRKEALEWLARKENP